MKVIIAGGGTGGHLYSGIAVHEILTRQQKHEVRFIGTRDGIEARVLPERRIDVRYIPVNKFRRSGPAAKVLSVATLPISGVCALVELLRFRPDVVLGVGGYASGPVVAAAALLGIRRAVIEQNSVAGFTNRMLGRFVGRAFLGLPGALSDFPRGVGIFVGNPVRNALFTVPSAGEKSSPFTVLVFGGSQGAHRINELIAEALPFLIDMKGDLSFIHMAGRHDCAAVKRAYEETGIRGEVYEFREDMERLYARAHWVIARSGAMTVSELAAARRPSLLIPYPFAVDDHQAKNADYLVDAGAARMIRQEELTGRRLASLIREAGGDRKGLSLMGQKAGRAARPDAAREIADWITNTGNGKK
jgi:UDP-N-acetylglucosamine--N-acetylmuramyl-(pentapeptide) pyrophosphoryl-undecaprenol N-acetylglucosamine transferase